jgi:hypothetical protein
MNINMYTDVANIGGNVSIQCCNTNGIITSEQTIHNNITSYGILNLLNSLCHNTTSYIHGIDIIVNTSGSMPSGDPTTPEGRQSLMDTGNIITSYNISSFNVIKGDSPYIQLKFYIESSGTTLASAINGKYIVGFNLLTEDSTNTEVVFANVSITDTIADSNTPVMSAVSKTSATTVIVLWRIGITSAFKEVIQ